MQYVALTSIAPGQTGWYVVATGETEDETRAAAYAALPEDRMGQRSNTEWTNLRIKSIRAALSGDYLSPEQVAALKQEQVS